MSDSSDLPAAPAIEGFFGEDAEGAYLIGTRCTACSTVFFPPERTTCRNPGCSCDEFEDTKLSRRGTLWSYTNNSYEPPPPYHRPKEDEDFTPFAIAAVELEAEKMVVVGMVPAPITCADLKVGMPMELTLDTLFEREGTRQITWKWRPVQG